MSLSAKYQDEDYDEYEEEQESKESIMPKLASISNWFIAIGMICAVILLVYFIVVGQVFTAFMFTLGLIVSYFFGYLFMFCLDKLTINND